LEAGAERDARDCRGLEVTLLEEINQAIKGHICMSVNEVEFLVECIKLAGNGDHLEIGSMWGGSAILAALTKKRNGITGKVVCVDPFRDMDWSSGRPGGRPNPDIFLSNMKAMGVEDMVELVCAYSNPWPLGKRKFSSIFVDGDHAENWPVIDWHNSKNRTDLVIYHDLTIYEKDVMRAVKIIRADSRWEEIGQVESIAAWKRKQ